MINITPHSAHSYKYLFTRYAYLHGLEDCWSARNCCTRTATLKSIDYNVAMTFILNNDNNIRTRLVYTVSKKPDSYD